MAGKDEAEALNKKSPTTAPGHRAAIDVRMNSNLIPKGDLR